MRFRLGIAAALVAGATLSGCLGGDERSGGARDGGSALVASPVPRALDPSLADDPAALQALSAVYPGLLTYRYEEGERPALVPGLARSLPRVSDDGLTWVLRLRPGLRYSNAAPVRPGDFERAVRRVIALDSPLAPLYEDVASIDANRRSGVIRVTLVAPDPTFADVLALPSSAPLAPRTPLRDVSGRPPPGAGAYRIARSQPGKRLVLLRSPGLGSPGIPPGHLDRIAMTRREPSAAEVRAAIGGSIDLMQDAAPTDLLPELRSRFAERYREPVAAATLVLVPDVTAPPLDDGKVRLAIGQSIDTQRLGRLQRGFLEPSCNLVPEPVPGYSALDPCPFGDRSEPPNLVEAKERVEKAGADGAAVGVWLGRGAPPRVAGQVVRALLKIGLHARVRGGGARLELRRLAPPVAHPAAFAEPLAGEVFDADLEAALAEAVEDQQGSGPEEVSDAWADVEGLLVGGGYAIPLGSERRPALFSARIDTDNCLAFDPVHGVDLASLCLR